jgi:hypothetical protein
MNRFKLKEVVQEYIPAVAVAPSLFGKDSDRGNDRCVHDKNHVDIPQKTFSQADRKNHL